MFKSPKRLKDQSSKTEVPGKIEKIFWERLLVSKNVGNLGINLTELAGENWMDVYVGVMWMGAE